MKIATAPILPGQTGHAVGRQLLQQLLGRPLPDIQITSRGKPYFPGSDLHFSISHTKGHAACVLSSRPVGIDLEELDRQVKPGLAEKILSPSEHRQYALVQDKNRALLTFWVLKEAAAKATGEGLRGYPNQTDFCLDDPRVQEIDGCLLAVIEL